MSKTGYGKTAPRPARLGELLRQLREQRELPLRAVAEAAGMDLTHLQKIELGQRVPTEAQTQRLAKFFKLDEADTQARRIAEKFRQEFADNPAAAEAIVILAEETGVYRTSGKPSNWPSPFEGERENATRGAAHGKRSRR